MNEERRTRLQQFLEDRIPEVRTEIQGYLQRMALCQSRMVFPTPLLVVLSRSAVRSVSVHIQRRRYAPRNCGSGDAWTHTVAAERADIVDYKTGAEDPGHRDQLRFYAMLWDQDAVANQDRTPVGILTVSYPTTEVTIPTPMPRSWRRSPPAPVSGSPRRTARCWRRSLLDARGTVHSLLGP